MEPLISVALGGLVAIAGSVVSTLISNRATSKEATIQHNRSLAEHYAKFDATLNRFAEAATQADPDEEIPSLDTFEFHPDIASPYAHIKLRAPKAVATTAHNYLYICKEYFAVDGAHYGENLLNAREMFIKAARESQENN